MRRDYALLIFDWDGTLADSTAQIVEGVQHAFAAQQLPPPTAAAVRHIIGLSLSEAVYRLQPDLNPAQTEAVIEAYKNHYFTRRSPTRLFDDALPVLNLLKQHHWLAVATGKGRRGLDLAMQETGSGDFFLATRTVDECAAKPQPEMVLSLCEELGVRPADALVIGDTTHDLNMAYNARSPAVALTTGAHSAAELQQAPHAAMLGGLRELAQWLGHD
ncbi:phosphoglycolate phosphatase [Neisseria sp. HSC-16F19]|nr:HAD-IA family hydrolase [Neisseria sp. HSC-16F19]MCP2041540.1 phosphoglycolate phosphatase [Neisseria sp. HSC-16F19]